MSVNLYIKDILVKQFSNKEEEILINRKLKDYRNIENIFGDYTESFTVPANANNEIFKHYYDADIDGGFDARIKQEAYIELDGELWKRGEVQLVDVEIKNNRAESYKIQFFGEVTQLVDLFGEDELSDLDYTDLEYPNTYASVKTGLENGLFSRQIIYPLLSYKRRFLYNTDVEGLDAETNADIALGGASDFEGIDYRELKPAIKVKTIFDKIQSFYNITFIGDVLTDLRFVNLYMNLVNEQKPQGETSKIIINNSFIFPNTDADLAEFRTIIIPNSESENIPYGVRYRINNVLVFDTGLRVGNSYIASEPGSSLTSYDFINESTNSEEEEDNLYSVEIYSNQDFVFDWDFELAFIGFENNSIIVDQEYSAINENLNSVINVGSLFQDFKVKDFIKTFVKAFNLVVIPINQTTIEFRSLQPWYAEGNIVDITNYVKTDKLRVAPGQLISGLDMKYEKSETFLSSVFKENNNRSFGELDIDFTDSNGRKFNGDTLTITLPFEKIVFERIGDVAYGYLVNREQEEFNPFHSIFYSLLTNTSVFLKNIEGTSEELTKVNRPSTSVINGGFACNFETEIDEFNNNASTDNFYTRYYADYVDDLFSPRRRQYNLEARLPKFISQNIKLNDRLLIGQRIYLINSFQQNLTTDNIKFELLNDIFTGAEALNQIIDVEDKFFLIESNSVTLTTNKVGNANISTIVSNESFVTPTFSGGQISLDVAENITGSRRNATITVTFDDEDNVEVLIKVIQNG